MAIKIRKYSGYSGEPSITKNILCEAYISRRDPFILAVCPHCGIEQIARWENYQISYFARRATGYDGDCEALKENKKLKLPTSIYAKTKKRIFNEITQFFSPNGFICECCGHSLSMEPGYLYSSCGKFFEDNNKSFPEVYTNRDDDYAIHNLKYVNQEKYEAYKCKKPYGGKIDDDQFIYTNNSLAYEFCEKNNIPHTHDDKTRNYMEEGRIVTIGKKILSGDDSYSDSYHLTVDETFELLRFYRKKMMEIESKEQISILIKERIELAENTVLKDHGEPSGETSFLKKYLYNLIQIETNIVSLSERLPVLYFTEKEASRLIYQVLNSNREEKVLTEANKNLQEAERYLLVCKENDDGWLDYYNKIMENYVEEPMPEKPEEPKKPELKKPGLFNRKKIEAENASKISAYDTAVAEWKLALNNYSKEIERIQEHKANKMSEARLEAKNKAKSDHLNDVESAQRLLEKAKEDLEKAKTELEEKNIVLHEPLPDNIWEQDVNQAEEMLKKCIDARVAYESMNVVFPKYRNLIAYSSFYEYLESGRCETLSGVNGAYNLYESELRQNMVISQLSKVLTSMEEIKANQFMVYSQLSRMNSSLVSLNSSMNKAVSSLAKIDANIKSIDDYTKQIAHNTEVTAYNTAATAYYSKINAELTKSLGYLIALK
ncbi:MAG: hypothetical protein J6I76_16740 [Oribacterium sp.]|nr:hypothetical protein [Oribacterium sp.]